MLGMIRVALELAGAGDLEELNKLNDLRTLFSKSSKCPTYKFKFVRQYELKIILLS